MTTTAQAAHLAILALITSGDREQAAGAAASMTLSGPAATQTNGTPARGWPTDQLPAGHYFNGHLIMTVDEDNNRAYSDVLRVLEPAVHAMFSEEVRRIALARMGTQPTVGRPVVGERVAVRLPDTLLTRVDRLARSRSITRARAIRHLIEAGLTLLDPADAVTEEEAAAMRHVASLAPVIDLFNTPAAELVAPGWETWDGEERG